MRNKTNAELLALLAEENRRRKALRLALIGLANAAESVLSHDPDMPGDDGTDELDDALVRAQLELAEEPT